MGIKCFALGFLLASVLLKYPAFIRSITSSNNDVIYKRPSIGARSSIKSIHLIGERHSGTKWVTSTLKECFGDQIDVSDRYTRFKHWFQYDDAQEKDYNRKPHDKETALVLVMFRDPYDWIDSMRTEPYHSPTHFYMDWRSFVTTPWTMERGHGDQQLIASGSLHNTTCMHRFDFDEIVPCSRSDRNMFNGTFRGHPVGVNYELNHDGSGRPYDSIIHLRRDKIINFLDVANFNGVKSLLPIQFEYLVAMGTDEMIQSVAKATGLNATCKPTPPRPMRIKDLDKGYVEWVTANVDWNVEKLVGYMPRTN